MEINVLYEDNHMLAVEKPVNIPVQADESKDRDLLNILKAYIKEKYNKPGNVYLGLVHRLDRPVGGAIVFARTSKAAARLANEIRKNQVERKYLAVTRGHLPADKGQLRDYLYKDRRKNKVSVVNRGMQDSKEAILDYKVLDRTGEGSLIEVRLQTGRSHQIRVQLANQDAPLYGDQKYGQYVNQPGEQIALWAAHLSVRHPTKDETVSVDCPPPDASPWNRFL